MQGTDRQFYGKPCTPYTMRNGIHSSWCFDPAANERPAEPTEQCGDHWTNVVNLSNEWQFYTVPFNSMLQQGWAKRSPSSISRRCPSSVSPGTAAGSATGSTTSRSIASKR